MQRKENIIYFLQASFICFVFAFKTSSTQPKKFIIHGTRSSYQTFNPSFLSATNPASLKMVRCLEMVEISSPIKAVSSRTQQRCRESSSIIIRRVGCAMALIILARATKFCRSLSVILHHVSYCLFGKIGKYAYLSRKLPRTLFI